MDCSPVISNAAVFPALRVRLTPAAKALDPPPAEISLAAICTATREEEHALSTLTHAPFNPKAYDTLPAATLVALPARLF